MEARRMRKALVAVVALGVLVAGVAAWFLLRPPAYASLRIARSEELPGTFGASVDPLSRWFDPAVTPSRALAIVEGQAVPERAKEMLAAVPPATLRATSGPSTPAWVIVTPGLCFASNKGDLVSSSRRDPSSVSRCSDRNMWVVMVNAESGRMIASMSAYDATGSWSPALGV
jgi:hypothetical protein